MSDNLLGKLLGQYELQELLGQGGMGTVYQAIQPSLNRVVAVKILPPSLARDDTSRARFIREAKTAAGLEHPHIVPIYDYGAQDDLPYVVMRYLPNGSLSTRIGKIARGPNGVDLAMIAALLKDLASALDYAHRKGVIHRDIKPSNIMFDEADNPMIVDFGIAKVLHGDHTTNLTGTGMALGTPTHMPPEQWRGEEVTPATDQYALAVVIYTLVSGHLPFEAPTPHGLMYKHLDTPPEPPHLKRSDIPPLMSEVLGRALAKDPKQRYEKVSAFAEAFEKAIISSGISHEAAPPTMPGTLPERFPTMPANLPERLPTESRTIPDTAPSPRALPFPPTPPTTPAAPVPPLPPPFGATPPAPPPSVPPPPPPYLTPPAMPVYQSGPPPQQPQYQAPTPPQPYPPPYRGDTGPMGVQNPYPSGPYPPMPPQPLSTRRMNGLWMGIPIVGVLALVIVGVIFVLSSSGGTGNDTDDNQNASEFLTETPIEPPTPRPTLPSGALGYVIQGNSTRTFGPFEPISAGNQSLTLEVDPFGTGNAGRVYLQARSQVMFTSATNQLLLTIYDGTELFLQAGGFSGAEIRSDSTAGLLLRVQGSCVSVYQVEQQVGFGCFAGTCSYVLPDNTIGSLPIGQQILVDLRSGATRSEVISPFDAARYHTLLNESPLGSGDIEACILPFELNPLPTLTPNIPPPQVTLAPTLTQVADSDGDGILDPVDECITIHGDGSPNGCPDSDGDNVTYSQDNCPNEAGPASNNGCP